MDPPGADDIVRRAQSIDDPAERVAFLDRECGDDSRLRAEVEARLLRGDTETSGLAATTGLDEPTDGPCERSGDRIGHYRLVRPLGEGGFGTVWMAEQEQPVRRQVALKVIKPGMDSRQVIARFTAERQALAMMDHPGIAKVFDAGTTETGRPYFVMELVDGARITEYCDRENLSTPDRLRLFVETCNAVQHAHQKGIIHRDLKPGNVLVALVDGKPVPKVIDFGIAKATSGTLTGHTLLTQVGQFVGTPAYMSPEQVEMIEPDIDTRSDIYALGVLLYELLTGTTPFEPVSSGWGGIAGMQRIIREQEPPRPSTRVSGPGRSHPATPPEQLARCRRTDPRTLRRLLRGDLDWIVMKALEKDRNRRYETANGFAMDVGRHLRGEPVVAAPPSPAYRMGKFVRRHRGLVVAAGLIALALVVGIAGITWGLLTATAQRALAEARATQLEQVARFQSEQLGGIDVPLMAERLREDLLNETRAAAERSQLDPAAIEARLIELDSIVADVDFAGMALHTLEANVFRRALDAIDSQFTDQPVVRARLLQTVARTVSDLGMLELAAEPQAEALRIRRAELGDDDPDTLESIEAAAQLLTERGQYDEAERLFLEALDGRRRTLGDDHPDTLDSLAGMGTLLYYEGRYQDAEPYYRDALEGRRRVLGDEDPQTVSSLRSMGYLLMALGRLDEAVELLRQALETCRRTLGDDDLATLKSHDALANALKWQDDYAEAESHNRAALEGRRRVLGSDHPATLISLSELGATLERQGKLDEAERCLREALERQQRQLGNDNMSTLQTMGRLAIVLYDQGRYDEAEVYYRDSLEGRRNLLGEDHPDTIVAVNNLGFLFMAMERYAEAEASFRDALEHSRRTAGDDHPATLTYRHNLGRALLAEGRLDDAEAQLLQALEGRRRVLGDEHPDTARTLTELGRVRTRAGRFADAEALLLEAWEASESEPVAEELVELYTAWEAAEPGRGYQGKVEEWRSRVELGEKR